MLLTITTTHRPATDLGYLLGKHPQRAQSFSLPFGRAHVCFPEATEERCTAALLLEVDPVGLVRRPKGQEGAALAQYTSDRPYVASSFMSVAIGRVLNQALGGRSRERPELATIPVPLEVRLSAIRGTDRLLNQLFTPLGYQIEIDRRALDESFPAWGPSPVCSLTLRAHICVAPMLRHLTVLIPVLDDEKHYFVGDEEIEKLLRRGEGWLEQHPARDLIVRRYLKHHRSLTREAMRRLSQEEPLPAPRERQAERDEQALEARLSLNDERVQTVVEVFKRHGAKRIVDLGCGEGKLVRTLLEDGWFERIVGVDVSAAALERASARLHLDELSPRARERVDLLQGSVTYTDARLQNFDGAALIEVIEHVDEGRLPALERAVFGHARPRIVVLTTPNVEFNVRFEQLPIGTFRHRDHRFEWTRARFASWAEQTALEYGYAVAIGGIGPVDPELGPPTQLGVFTR